MEAGQTAKRNSKTAYAYVAAVTADEREPILPMGEPAEEAAPEGTQRLNCVPFVISAIVGDTAATDEACPMASAVTTAAYFCRCWSIHVAARGAGAAHWAALTAVSTAAAQSRWQVRGEGVKEDEGGAVEGKR